MLKSKKTILGVILCTLMALCFSVGVVGLNQKTEKAFASGGTISTIAYVLATVEGGFPTTYESGWVNESGTKSYFDENSKYGAVLFFAKGDQSVYQSSAQSVEKVSNTQYKVGYSETLYEFNMDTNGKLVNIELSGNFSSFFKGTYYPQPKVNDTFTADGINYVVTYYGETNTVKVGDNTSFEGTSVTIPATVTYKGVDFNVTEIGAAAFSFCSQLESVLQAFCLTIFR